MRLGPPNSLGREWEFWESFSQDASLSHPEGNPERRRQDLENHRELALELLNLFWVVPIV